MTITIIQPDISAVGADDVTAALLRRHATSEPMGRACAALTSVGYQTTLADASLLDADDPDNHYHVDVDEAAGRVTVYIRRTDTPVEAAFEVARLAVITSGWPLSADTDDPAIAHLSELLVDRAALRLLGSEGVHLAEVRYATVRDLLRTRIADGPMPDDQFELCALDAWAALVSLGCDQQASACEQIKEISRSVARRTAELSAMLGSSPALSAADAVATVARYADAR